MTDISIEDLKSERDRVLSIASAIAAGQKIGIYGAGFLGHWAINWLREQHIEPIGCFDTNPARHGEEFNGVTISPPSAISTLSPYLVLITARHAVRDVETALKPFNVTAGSLDAVFVASTFDKFMHVYDALLADERSRLVLRRVLMTMLTGERSHLSDIHEGDQYFCLPHFIGGGREVYLDAGAYVGDSIERFIWSSTGVFSGIVAFEPAARQFKALERRTARLVEEWALDPTSIELNNAGVSQSTERMSATTASGQLQSTSLAPDTSGNIATIALDDHLSGRRVTFIKADVEGMEMQLLRGAADTIRREKPKLAICVYHYPCDIPEIAGYIHHLVPEYRFALRHHSPHLMETVLYCWTE